MTPPKTMRAVAVREPLPIENADALIDVELPVPEPGPRDVLVQVKAVSINPVDVKTRNRAVAGQEPKVLGYDASGVVTAVGTEVAGFKVGDEVAYAGAITRPGSNSEFQLVDERIVGPKPASLSYLDAAALPLTSLTAWECLFDRLGVAEGSEGTLLVIGGAGGVGSMITQLAKKLTGLRVIATASRPQSRAWAEQMGADHVIDHTLPLAEQVTATVPGGVDYVFSAYTEAQLPGLADAMAPQSHLVIIDEPQVSLASFKAKSIAVHWESMFTRAIFQTPDMGAQGEILRRVAALIDAGSLVTTTATALQGLSAQTIREGHRLIESGRTTGKVVVSFDD